LNATYERILYHIPRQHWKKARTALQLLCSTNSDVFRDPLALAEAVVVDVEEGFNTSARMLRPVDFLSETCSSLVKLEPIFCDNRDSAVFNLSHSTVKEYLRSNRVRESEFAFFHVSEQSMQYTAWVTSLMYLVNLPYDGSPLGLDDVLVSLTEPCEPVASLKQEYPLLPAAFASLLGPSDALSKPQLAGIHSLLIKLFNPRETSRLWLQWRAAITDGEDSFQPFWKAEPGLELHIVLGLACYFRRPSLVAEILETQPGILRRQRALVVDTKYCDTWVQRWEATYTEEDDDIDVWLPQGSPLHVALGFDSVQSVKAILSHTRHIRQLDRTNTMPLLCLALRTGQFLSTFCGNERDAELAHHYLDLLLDAGADPNPYSASETPLQTAARLGDRHAIQRLLDAGAQVNDVADDAAVVARLRRHVAGMKEGDAAETLRTRGLRHFYKTPLRLLLDFVAERLAEADYCGGERSGEREELENAINLLISNGGLDLCLFPHEDLPGYEEESWAQLHDMQRRVRRRDG